MFAVVSLVLVDYKLGFVPHENRVMVLFFK